VSRIKWQGAVAVLPVDVGYFVAGPPAGASGRGVVADAVLAEASCGEPDDVGVDRDLNDGAVVLPAGAAGECVG
jgi:hypothetical protein